MAGLRVSLVGSGFPAGRSGPILLGTRRVGTVRTTASGSFSTTFVVPRGLRFGNKRLLAAVGKRRVAGVFRVSRRAGAPSSSMTAVSGGRRVFLTPIAGRAGTRLRLFGWGFPRYGLVRLFFAGILQEARQASARGRFSASFAVPAAAPGARAVTVQSGRRILRTSFVILPEASGRCRDAGRGRAGAGSAGIDQIHLAWVEEPSTTLTVVWHTDDATTPSTVQYRAKGQTAWQTQTGRVRPSGTTGKLHEVTLRSLAPDTAYEYRVPGADGTWSDVFTSCTAPQGHADFDFAYVADTGLIGRMDGLATGTKQVRDEIAKLDPLLVLGGGDFAYFNTDKRYGSLDNTIDVWFNQMQPIAARSPLMPAYGNHEILLGEGYEPWAARFPTPSGIGGPDARQNYSFDVGDVHFTSIMAVYDGIGLTQETLDWIDRDLSAAKAAGKRWLIPFMHVPSFGDGTNHPQNKTLRAQLAPIFERHAVKLVIASHDQAYERSYPLRDATATSYTVTSTSKRCYSQSDGVVWVKVSPGGKLSNISSAFAPFAHATPPSWTAYRNNTMHHFLYVRVFANGSIRVDAYAVTGDGTPPVIDDTFALKTGSCTG